MLLRCNSTQATEFLQVVLAHDEFESHKDMFCTLCSKVYEAAVQAYDSARTPCRRRMRPRHRRSPGPPARRTSLPSRDVFV